LLPRGARRRHTHRRHLLSLCQLLLFLRFQQFAPLLLPRGPDLRQVKAPRIIVEDYLCALRSLLVAARNLPRQDLHLALALFPLNFAPIGLVKGSVILPPATSCPLLETQTVRGR